MRRKIVILDAHTIKPEELDWSSLQTLGEVTLYARTAPEELLERAEKAEVLLTNKVALDQNRIKCLPNLKYIGVTATGTNVVDLAAARARNIPVTNVPAYSTPSVAQATIGLMLNLAHGINRHSNSVAAGDWTASSDWCYWHQPLVELAGLTLGIIGFGEIGRQVARLAQALDMNVLVTTRRPKDFPDFIRSVTLPELLQRSDVVSLHCPLTEETRGLINRDRLALMKATAFLINTSRGTLIDEKALATALNSGQLAGAGLDVLSTEPPARDNPLLRARNCIITPHLAWGTLAARRRLLEIVVANLRGFLEGRPQNVVN